MSDADQDAAQLLARWAARDAAIGLAAELEQVQARLADRDREVANLRERGERLAQRVAQLTAERDRLQHEVAGLRRPSFARRAVGKAVRVGRRVLRS